MFPFVKEMTVVNAAKDLWSLYTSLSKMMNRASKHILEKHILTISFKISFI